LRLLGPVVKRLRGKDRLIVVPDGPLWELPFQALSTSGQRYLLDDAVIAYAPSVTVLRETMALQRRPLAGEGALTLLAMGNPAIEDAAAAKSGAPLMDGPLEALPDAERQVRSLAQIYGARGSRIYVGADAREDRFKADAGRFRIIHLATHGILNDRNPMYSQLVLARGPGAASEDGVLEAWELMQLDLSADLAVLSACETARGRVGRGEGMLGLTWSLFVAGVPTTVVSQWKVRADSTAELMIAFHRRLTQTRSRPSLRTGSRGHGVASALRDAALEVRADPRYRHPFHWAAFIAVGDGH
jgi:CHAT domain-containing protein